MSITALLSRIVFVNLQKRLSINVPRLSENLVGSMIWEYILCDVRRSKKSLIHLTSAGLCYNHWQRLHCVVFGLALVKILL